MARVKAMAIAKAMAKAIDRVIDTAIAKVMAKATSEAIDKAMGKHALFSAIMHVCNYMTVAITIDIIDNAITINDRAKYVYDYGYSYC